MLQPNSGFSALSVRHKRIEKTDKQIKIFPGSNLSCKKGGKRAHVSKIMSSFLTQRPPEIGVQSGKVGEKRNARDLAFTAEDLSEPIIGSYFTPSITEDIWLVQLGDQSGTAKGFWSVRS
jgi:hypothetical protein